MDAKVKDQDAKFFPTPVAANINTVALSLSTIEKALKKLKENMLGKEAEETSADETLNHVVLFLDTQTISPTLQTFLEVMREQTGDKHFRFEHSESEEQRFIRHAATCA